MTHETRPIDHSGHASGDSATPEKLKLTTWQRFVEALDTAKGKTRVELAAELGVSLNQINKYVSRINTTIGKWIITSNRGKIAIDQALLAEYHDFLMSLPSSEATMDKYGTESGRHTAQTKPATPHLPKPVPRHDPANHSIEDTMDDTTGYLEGYLQVYAAIEEHGAIGGEAL